MSEQLADVNAMLRDELVSDKPQDFIILYFDQESMWDSRDIQDLVRGIFASAPAWFTAETDDGCQAGKLMEGILPREILDLFIRTDSGNAYCSLQFLTVFGAQAEFSVGSAGHGWSARLIVDGPEPHTVIDPQRREKFTGWYRTRAYALRRHPRAQELARGGALVHREYFTADDARQSTVDRNEKSGTSTERQIPESTFPMLKAKRLCGVLDEQQYQAYRRINRESGSRTFEGDEEQGE
ncbi:MAG: hypothetical protein IJ228_14145 [Succinivibrio sp.]|nr:hypothetical protein [Succinivibrio sp.]